MNNGANTNATIVISLINIFNEGPDVSLYGSPTVLQQLPLHVSVPLPLRFPSSIYFFALSQAPPEFDI